MIPTVAIVGRPNVGKSSLFNLLAKRRISIVEPTPGVTRDRVSTIVEDGDFVFELIDTGGITMGDADGLDEEVRHQIEIAIQIAAVILFVIDVQDGVLPIDKEIADKLRRIGKPVILVANKADNELRESEAAAAAGLGFGDPVVTSAVHSRGRGEILDALRKHLPVGEGKPAEAAVKIAIVGRRNVGKSTFLNTILGEERAIVSPVPGTTRDSIDARLERGSTSILLIDTAGLRKKRQISSPIELFSMARSERAIRRADVVLLMLDATERISIVDKQLAATIQEQYKPCVIVVNKWDLARDVPTEKFSSYVANRLTGLSAAPIVYISALRGFNTDKVLDIALDLRRQSTERVPTSYLNRVVEQAWGENHPRPVKNKYARLYYAAQVAGPPPTIVLFVNDARLFPDDYVRYLTNRFHQLLPFREVPIRLKFVSHRAKKGDMGG